MSFKQEALEALGVYKRNTVKALGEKDENVRVIGTCIRLIDEIEEKEGQKTFMVIDNTTGKKADPYEIAKTAGVGIKSAVFLSLLHELVRRYEREKMDQKPALTSIQRSVEYCRALLAFRPRECFYAICLDSRRKILHTSKVSEGTVGDAAVSPRLVVEKALRYKAMGILLCHNHPNGNAKPSYNDINLTAQLKKMLEPLGVEVLDHIIIGENQYFSFFENNMLKSEDAEG